jgi:hypothetical protein
VFVTAVQKNSFQGYAGRINEKLPLFSDYMLQLLGQFVFVKHKRTFLGKVWNKSLLITFIPMK